MAEADIINRIRGLLPTLNIGDVYFVDGDNGVNGVNRGTRALPLKTISYTLANYVTSYNGDLVLCWASNGGQISEPDDINLSMGGTSVLGVGWPLLMNVNQNPNRIFKITGDACRIAGFRMKNTQYDWLAMMAIECLAKDCIIGMDGYGNVFEHFDRDVILSGEWNKCFGNKHILSHWTYVCDAGRQTIHKNIMSGLDADDDKAVWLRNACDSTVCGNIISKYGTAIKADQGSIGNTGTRNTINTHGHPPPAIVDPNPTGKNNWMGNDIMPIS